MKQPWLIQRASIEYSDYNKGLDSIITLDYMGSSEFEWGAVPNSLKRIRSNINKYVYRHYIIDGKNITGFFPVEFEMDIPTVLLLLSERNVRLKERTDFDIFVGKNKVFTATKINFWWDIENDWMFWKTDSKFEKKFQKIIKGE